MRVLRNQSGIVALLTSVFISLLVLIIVTAMIAVALKEQRQSSDNDQSIRAFFAAQAGVEDALLKIKDKLNAGQDLALLAPTTAAPCINSPLPTTADLGNDTQLTCQRILSQVNEVRDSVDFEQPAQFDMPGILFDKMEILWNQSDDAANYFTDLNYTAGVNNFPSGGSSATRWNIPAALEVTAVGYTAGATVSLSGIKVNSLVLRPTASGTPDAQVPIQLGGGGTNPGPHGVQCRPGGYSGFDCKATITSFNTAGCSGSGCLYYVVRMVSKYRGTHYAVRFFNNGAQVTNIPEEAVTIDVTAKSGSVYRRIISKLPIRSGVAGGLDYVLYSDTDICKFPTFENDVLTNGGSQPVGPDC